MKTAFFALGLAVVAASVNAIDYVVASCAELADIDDTTVTCLTITSSPFECDSYTRFRVRNDMVLKSGSAVEFSNFALKELGTLIVEPDVTFQDVAEQNTNGGALYVDKGASATFMGTALFTRNSVKAIYGDPYRTRHGGAVFNKGDLVFEGDAVFVQNEARTPDSISLGRGGAIYNARIGTITFKAKLTANENEAFGFFVGQGGAIYTSGDIVVGGVSSFADNEASDGGADYVHERGTITFNDFATFADNVCQRFRGGAIASYGSLNLMAGSLFQSNFADSAGDGGLGDGIYNGGKGFLTFNGDNTFDDNWAYKGGAIYNAVDASITPPQEGGEIIYENLRGEICPGINYQQVNSDVGPVCGP